MSNLKYPEPSGFKFSIPFRVRFHHCDPHGHVHHSTYLKFLEDIRMEYWRLSGTDYGQFEKSGKMFFVADSYIKYLGSARFDDEIVVYTRVTEHTRTSLIMEYIITPKGLEDLILYGRTTLVCVNAESRRPVRIPDFVINGIVEFESGSRVIEASIAGA